MIDKSMHFSKSCVNSHLKVYDLGRDKIVECFTTVLRFRRRIFKLVLVSFFDRVIYYQPNHD